MQTSYELEMKVWIKHRLSYLEAQNLDGLTSQLWQWFVFFPSAEPWRSLSVLLRSPLVRFFSNSNSCWTLIVLLSSQRRLISLWFAVWMVRTTGWPFLRRKMCYWHAFFFFVTWMNFNRCPLELRSFLLVLCTNTKSELDCNAHFFFDGTKTSTGL